MSWAPSDSWFIGKRVSISRPRGDDRDFGTVRAMAENLNKGPNQWLQFVVVLDGGEVSIWDFSWGAGIRVEGDSDEASASD